MINWLLLHAFLISFLSANIYFLSPDEGQQFPVNGVVEVIFQTGNPVAIVCTQTCGSNVETKTCTGNLPTNFDLPTNYIGSCYYFGTSREGAGGPLFIGVYGTVSISQPVQSPKQTATADTTIPVSLSITPTNPEITFTVQLDCGIAGVSPAIAPYNGAESSINFLIPFNFFGSDCVFSLIDLPEHYTAQSPSTVTINVVNAKSPTGGSLYPITQEQINAFLEALRPNPISFRQN